MHGKLAANINRMSKVKRRKRRREVGKWQNRVENYRENQWMTIVFAIFDWILLLLKKKSSLSFYLLENWGLFSLVSHHFSDFLLPPFLSFILYFVIPCFIHWYSCFEQFCLLHSFIHFFLVYYYHSFISSWSLFYL